MHLALSLNGDIKTLQDYLQKQAWISPNEIITSVEKPGEGNMNIVLRVITNQKSIIVKQARPYVQKYPDIPAPIERIAVENDFYALVSEIATINSYMPKRIGFDAENFVMVVEDLGKGSDFTSLYQKRISITDETIKDASNYLSNLHGHSFDESTRIAFSDNLSLRKLNYEHLFVYPLMIENGFNLDDIQAGLQAVAMMYKTDEALAKKMKSLGELYLSSGNVLLHGDFYPGSWLNVNGAFKVIDPEFCFFGIPEYDLGVMIAHLKMAQISDNQIDSMWKCYQRGDSISKQLVNQFIGMELLRRLIGLAQLPLELTLLEKENLLIEARKLIMK